MFGYTPNYGIGLDDSGAPMLGLSPGDPTGSGLGNPAVNIARARAGSVFGIKPPSRNSYMWAGGLRAAQPVVPHNFGANLIAGLTGGLAGSLQGANQYNQVATQQQMAQANMERQWQLEQVAQQRADALDKRNAIVEQHYMDLADAANAREKAAGAGKNQWPQGVYTQSQADNLQGPLPPGAIKAPDVAGTSPEAMNAYLTTTARNKANQEAPGISLDPSGANLAAMLYAYSGAIPYLRGPGGPQAMAGIINRAGQQYPGTNIAANKANLSANTQSITLQQKQYDMQAQFAASIERNLRGAEQALPHIPETGVQAGNMLARGAASQFGSKWMQQFTTSMKILKPEFAKILQQGTASGAPLTDYAMKDLEAATNENATRDQLQRAIDVLRADTGYKLFSSSNQLNAAKARIYGALNPGANPNLNMYQNWGQYQFNRSPSTGMVTDQFGNLVPAQEEPSVSPTGAVAAPGAAATITFVRDKSGKLVPAR